ncbi:class I SAM-dependent methyltransferase [Mycobacterium asiaticum]|uniref:S-adenosyl-L-methionine-dependent methyltransferase n=1 Tax=Mycobacterium asiaticum TaxID=1790 RepID=A0A1A3ILS9_MYCAS|nr:class I SAM-dependent methyltransferase [Mycobacterium asiaticum]OBI99054.1 SAM-dependent methyltransferase [Mycobacterium asiaticum]OBJ61577.1 SAM-dependent methyltransferase [Mycobacterium asiaticum]OBJ86752.1 SAM-dependent methyltransferase [Mycobacterium asiaticum]ORA10830.1 SAM-dependent methyltransferase [Mycobacterium asiaticum DSM 44297]
MTEYGSLRSDDDQWDIVSGVGYTALIVAAWRALHAVGEQPLVRDDYAKLFIEASADPYLNGLLADPGTSEHESAFPRLYGVQTRFFDEFFTTACGAGIRQAVIVAAGLDSRAYRLDWPTGTTVFEIDLPKVLEFKSQVLGEHGARPKAERREAAADLRTDWPAALVAAGFDPNSPSAWSLEGLLPYLTSKAHQALFAGIGELSAPGSRLAIGALGSRLDHDQLAQLEESHPGVNVAGDIDFSSLTYENPTDPTDWLVTDKWAIESVRNTLDLQAGYGLTPPEVDIKIDSFMHSQYIIATR